MNQEQLEKAKKLFFILLSIDIVINAIAGFNSFSTVEILKNVQSGTRILDQSLINSVDFLDKFSMLTILTLIGVGLGLVKWLNSCYRFAKESIGATGFKNEKWTVVGWIIPLFNLFKPYQVINEIYKAGSSNYSVADDWKKENGSWLLLTWWIFWAVSHFFMWIFGKEMLKKSLRDDLTLSQAIGIYEIQAWLFVFSIIVAALWFIVAENLTQRFLNRSTKISRNAVSVDDDNSYKIAYEEMSSGQFQTATWAKAFAHAEGNQDKAKALYIKYRVEQLAVLAVKKPQAFSPVSSTAELPDQHEVAGSVYSENKSAIAVIAVVGLIGVMLLLTQIDRKPAASNNPSQKSETTSQSTSSRLSFEPEMVRIAGGCFQMGSPQSQDGHQSDEQQHQVCLRDFEIGIYEVTQRQWQAVMGNNPSQFQGCPDCPVEKISWNEIQDYLSKLNQQTRKAYRLPTEAEWENACRGGAEGQRYCGGDNPDRLAWYDDNSGFKTHPVGQKTVNSFGLYDMSGNVWEWTCSTYNKGYGGAEQECTKKSTDGPLSVRGGGWSNRPTGVRSAYRYWLDPAGRFTNTGFRLARSL